MTKGNSVFLCGTLCDLELLEIVAGEALAIEHAALDDHAVYWAVGQSIPIVQRALGETAQGILINPSPSAKARLDFYQLGFGNSPITCAITFEGNVKDAEVYFAEPGRWSPGARWSLTDWQNKFGELAREAAAEYIRLSGRKPPSEAAQLFGQVRSRASSRLRARAASTPNAFQPERHRQDVTVKGTDRPLLDFFDVVQEQLSFRTFKGEKSATIDRISLIGGDAVTVLPYDPSSDKVLIIRQFRHGAFSRGDLNPWCLEPVAGRIDPYETAEDAARRELVEEAGVEANSLHKIASYYPTPAAVSEHLTSFVATAELSGADGHIGGLASENEDIMSHVISFDELMELIQSGAANTGPLIMSALWLQVHRQTLV